MNSQTLHPQRQAPAIESDPGQALPHLSGAHSTGACGRGREQSRDEHLVIGAGAVILSSIVFLSRRLGRASSIR